MKVHRFISSVTNITRVRACVRPARRCFNFMTWQAAARLLSLVLFRGVKRRVSRIVHQYHNFGAHYYQLSQLRNPGEEAAKCGKS